MTAYYNEYDPQAAAWLRELIKAGLIAPGEVDERSIADVKADDIRGFTQCHFFAGIGGWSYALRLAGWADDRPVWTGSPPCQPFSNAGKQKAQADARHLWPVFFNLVRECHPANIFGEQVEAAIRTGWLDDLQDDLEAENYATGKIVLPACSVGGFHIRQRIWFVAERVADTNSSGRGEHCGSQSIQAEQLRVKQHRYFMERHIGRRLLPAEDVHHINGIKTDNRIENLVIITHANHSKITHASRPRKTGYKMNISDDERKNRSEKMKKQRAAIAAAKGEV